MLIICSFTLFLCLFLLIIIVIYVNIGLLYSVIQYSIINTKIDNYSYGALNAFQVSLLTNVSSNEISKIIYNTDSDYILTRIFNYIASVDEFFQFIDKLTIFKNIDDVMNLSCQSIAQINDQAVSLVKEKLDINLEVFIEKFCQTRYITSFNSSMIIQKEIGYLMLKLTNFPIIVEYQEKLIFLTSKDIFSLYNLILFINRKIRFYMNNHLIPTIVLTISDKSKIVISVLLGMNCFLELSVIIVKSNYIKIYQIY